MCKDWGVGGLRESERAQGRAGVEYKKGGSRRRESRRSGAARVRCWKVTRSLPGSWVPIPTPQKHPAGLNRGVWGELGVRERGEEWWWGGQERRGAHSQNKAPLYPSHPPPAPHGSSLSPPLSPLQPSDTPAQANYQALCSRTDLLALMRELTRTRSVRNNAYQELLRACAPRTCWRKLFTTALYLIRQGLRKE